jgi:DNA repair protein RadC
MGYELPIYRASIVREGSSRVEATRAGDPRSAAAAVRALIPEDDERERFVALFLDARHKVRGATVVSIGTLAASLVHPREVFRPAILAGASGIVLGHNHPSGDPEPSDEDIRLTHRLVAAGQLLGIEVLDHVVVGASGRFVSLRERGAV